MVKVISEGEPWRLEFDCGGCGARLEATEADVQAGQFGVKDEYDYEYYVTCPLCQTKRRIPAAQVGLRARNMADSKYRQERGNDNEAR